MINTCVCAPCVCEYNVRMPGRPVSFWSVTQRETFEKSPISSRKKEKKKQPEKCICNILCELICSPSGCMRSECSFAGRQKQRRVCSLKQTALSLSLSVALFGAALLPRRVHGCLLSCIVCQYVCVLCLCVSVCFYLENSLMI